MSAVKTGRTERRNNFTINHVVLLKSVLVGVNPRCNKAGQNISRRNFISTVIHVVSLAFFNGSSTKDATVVYASSILRRLWRDRV